MLVVGVGEYAITNDIKESIVTYSLGSCVALILYNPLTKKTALAHIVLPSMAGHTQDKILYNRPGYFADSVVPILMEEFLKKENCVRNQLEVFIAGGAVSRNTDDVFKIGTRNVTMVQHILSSYGIVPKKMEVGGMLSRTVRINVANGEISIKDQEMK